jgi:D-alanyl-D-alanine-carboxypeptidase/D-alanyl-D-alanine-endopeptidase
MMAVYPTSKQKTKWIILAFLGILLFEFASVACGSKESNISEGVKDNIRRRIENGESVGIVVGFINPSGKREYFCVGTSTMGGEKYVNENSIYEIGSISKAFTGIVLADMVLNNEVKLDDPAEFYLPETVNVPSRNGIKITLEHLATHTSALARMPSNFHPADPGNPYADYSVENMYEFISGYTLGRDIGEKYEYSNLGMGLLGHILSLKAGVDYEQLIIERICNVLGMKSTVISLTEEIKERLARGHNPAGEVPNWDIPTLAGAGAIRSTAHDMLTFLAANMGIKRSKISAAMDMAHEARIDAGENLKVGLGWHISDNGKTRIIWHNGGTGGYRTFCGFVKDKKIGVVVLSNMNISADDIGFHLLDNYYELKKIEEPMVLKPEMRDKYTGKYKFTGTDITVTVTHEGNMLLAQIQGQGKIAVFPQSETEFVMKEAPIKITFQVDVEGNVTGFVLNQDGKDSAATRID